MSLRLVAPMTITPDAGSIPSISCSSWLTWRPYVSHMPRAPATASISSMKTIDGLFSRARSKSCAMSFSDSPSHLLVMSAADTG